METCLTTCIVLTKASIRHRFKSTNFAITIIIKQVTQTYQMIFYGTFVVQIVMGMVLVYVELLSGL